MPNTLEDFNIVGDGDVLNVTCMICHTIIVSVEDGDSLDAIVEVSTEHEHRTITPQRAIDLALFAIATLNSPEASSKDDLESLRIDQELAVEVLVNLRNDFGAGRQLPHEWEVGDEDPTPEELDKACGAWGPNDDPIRCTWPVDPHPPVHVAGNGDEIVGVWPVTDESPIGSPVPQRRS